MQIKIKNIKCETILGIYAFEKTQKVPVMINVSIDYNEGNAPLTDNIEDTINYHPLVDAICTHVNNTSFGLVEKVVEDVGQIIMKHEKVRSCKVRVDKTKTPLKHIESFSVSKTFKRT